MATCALFQAGMPFLQVLASNQHYAHSRVRRWAIRFIAAAQPVASMAQRNMLIAVILVCLVVSVLPRSSAKDDC